MNEVADRIGLFRAAEALDILAEVIHNRNIQAGWWKIDDNGNVIERNVPEMLCLVHSEISEAMEGDRKGLADDKLPQYPMYNVELIDAFIRMFDMLGRSMSQGGPKLSEVLMAKLDYNMNREDHKPEVREAEGGKKY